jgi:hypothetical protein
MRMSVRDLLWLLSMGAILTAWWLDHRTNVANVRRLGARNSELQLEVVKANERAEESLRILTATTNAIDGSP